MKGAIDEVKKSSYAICAATLALSLVALPKEEVNAEVFEAIPISEEIHQSKYIEIAGTISKITESQNGQFATVDSEENPFGFYFDDQTIILDNTGKEIELKEGMKFKAYVDSSKPTILIYPPQYSPDVIIVETEELGSVQLDVFDENYLNKGKDLYIRFGEESELINLSGTEITKEAIIDQEVLIFIDVVLESYPAQAYPSKVILLQRDEEIEDEQANIEKAYRIAEEDQYIVNGVQMVPLRLIAEQLGYQVDSTGRGAVVSKGNVSYLITRGTTKYKLNNQENTFAEAPALLEPRKTYVPYDFVHELVGKN